MTGGSAPPSPPAPPASTPASQAPAGGFSLSEPPTEGTRVPEKLAWVLRALASGARVYLTQGALDALGALLESLKITTRLVDRPRGPGVILDITGGKTKRVEVRVLDASSRVIRVFTVPLKELREKLEEVVSHMALQGAGPQGGEPVYEAEIPEEARESLEYILGLR